MRSLDDVTGTGAGRVVVALDGSASSIRALRQGARIAGAIGLRLEVVTVWRRSDLSGGSLGGRPDLVADGTIAAIEAMQEQGIEAVFGAAPPTGLVRKVLEGATIPALLQESEGAEMLVLGSRGRGGFAGLLLGSVSAACAAHATCAVLVCRSEATGERPRAATRDRSEATGREELRAPAAARHPVSANRAGTAGGDIVVGVDGTRASLGALRQGARFAESMHLPLLAICASGGSIASASEATAVLTRASRQLFGSTPPRWFRSSVRDGTPAVVLGRASERARMLIIGHSGSGTPTTARESVSSTIALEAICPVVIFHATHPRDAGAFDGVIV